MEEKIKVSLAKETLELLKKDCGDFKILKADGSPNFNSFINLLSTTIMKHLPQKRKLCTTISAALSPLSPIIIGKKYSEAL